ncbi:hypothetical protein QQ020_13275 [Fulvivirgaceae bacterium BMA12]|uniref:Lipoprotein n=1 Tax=Agaribacillus aureus TaxID=3051825 RepID=A0ABT8L7R0_9BACT|nr:hypothetical protein [Fulvivirgaceae bacterium BMA12]
MKKNIAFPFLILMLVACSDDESSVDFDPTKTYNSSRIVHSNIRVFNSSGEIKAQESKNITISRFQEINSIDFQFLAADKPLQADESENLHFEKDLAIAGDESFDYIIENDLIRFIALDTTVQESANPTFLDHLGVYTPGYEEITLNPAPLGTVFITKSLEEKYARIKEGQLWFPQLYFYHYSYGRLSTGSQGDDIYGIISTIASSLNNELNEGISTNLQSSDTLLVQTNWLVFE